MLVAVEKKELIKGIKTYKKKWNFSGDRKKKEIYDKLVLPLASVNCTFTHLSHMLAPF